MKKTKTQYHSTIRSLAERPIQMADDTPEGIRTPINAINSKKAPGEDGITSDIFQRAYKQFPCLINNFRVS